jgi:hypothetical protein
MVFDFSQGYADTEQGGATVMKNEMDVMGMNGRRRLAWLRANRLTLFTVGVVWIGMIVRELLRGEAPYFMIAMVPVFALLRYVLYRSFAGRG